MLFYFENRYKRPTGKYFAYLEGIYINRILFFIQFCCGKKLKNAASFPKH
jgi:hypothetical protein